MAPIFVEDPNTILGGGRAHGLGSFSKVVGAESGGRACEPALRRSSGEQGHDRRRTERACEDVSARFGLLRRFIPIGHYEALRSSGVSRQWDVLLLMLSRVPPGLDAFAAQPRRSA